ncbi:MAG: SGNH/GDSL hydrolase family protein [Ignavibacteriaceae bacterium]|jgi:phospholipase/lecithinase/hemolysin|nr:SGNH/GDSL hydrolase family protein [Ignavibacteriaceae bacterium]MCU0415021.1 SGNH/GDSL hydrolase family protein [Ignavibacteriaceae bacterium]
MYLQLILFFVLVSVIVIAQNNNESSSPKRINKIIVFGDGLSDMGQWGKLTNFRYPPADAGFFESRWTNGKVWVEHLADELNIKLTLNENFALGGATTGYYNINESLRLALQLDSTVKLNGMLGQVADYLSTNPQVDNKILFVLWAGGHDIGSYLDYGQPDLKKYPPAENYKQAVSMLVNAGAKLIMIGTMPDMGFTPTYFGTELQEKASKLCTELNDGIENIIASYQNSDVKFIKIDGAKIFSEVGMNPAKYEIKYLEPYLPINIIDFNRPLEKSNVEIPNKEKGLNPDEFINWWAVSASAKMHTIIGEYAIQEFLKTIK